MNAPHPLPQPLTYSEQKLKELLLYVAERLVDDPEFGSVKLNNVLFYSDFYAYGDFGDPITGSTYIRLERGPAPRQLPEVKARLVDAQDAVEAPSTHFGY